MNDATKTINLISPKLYVPLRGARLERQKLGFTFGASGVIYEFFEQRLRVWVEHPLTGENSQAGLKMSSLYQILWYINWADTVLVSVHISSQAKNVAIKAGNIWANASAAELPKDHLHILLAHLKRDLRSVWCTIWISDIDPDDLRPGHPTPLLFQSIHKWHLYEVS